MKAKTNSHSTKANVAHSLLLTLLLSISCLQVALAQSLDPANFQIESFPVGSSPENLVFDGANIWVTNWSDNTVTKLRASDGANLGTFRVGRNPYHITFDGANI